MVDNYAILRDYNIRCSTENNPINPGWEINLDTFQEEFGKEFFNTEFYDDGFGLSFKNTIINGWVKFYERNELMHFEIREGDRLLSVKEFFNNKGDRSGFIKLGKQASLLYREMYNGEQPPKSDELEDGYYVNVYPKNILEKLEPLKARPVTEVWVSPIIQKDLQHGWNMEYRRYTELQSSIIPFIKGTLSGKFKVDKTLFSSYVYQFDLIRETEPKTIHVTLKSSITTRRILANFIKSNIQIGDTIKIEISSGNEGWANITTYVNGKQILSKTKIEDEDFLDFLKTNNELYENDIL